MIFSVLGLAAWFAAGPTIAITGARVYPASAADPLPNATVLIRDGRIVSVGPNVRISTGTELLRCDGCTVVAGFWNGHVHFTEPKWDNAAALPAPKLTEQLSAMVSRSGFTTVVDTASDPRNTVVIRKRIESGEVHGPRILTAGSPIYPPDGIPFYVRESISPEILKLMQPPANAAEAEARVRQNFDGGADLVKLFTGSWVARGKVLPLPEAIAKAAVAVAHEKKRLVYAHPSSLAGIEVALASGVDILAHAPDDTRGIDDAVIRKLVDRRMVMIPTLKLFSGSQNIESIRQIVRRFHEMGGRLMFGTDTGYLTDYEVATEFAELGKCGLDGRAILRMLTETPADVFGEVGVRGRVEPGVIADLTILEADPIADPAAFSRVRYTIRGGRVIP